jgi:hypothetical protein
MTNATLNKPKHIGAKAISPTSRSQERLHDELYDLLSELVSAHEALLAAAGEHRESLRTADTEAMAAASIRVDAICRDIAGLDEHRKQLTATLAPTQPEATLSFLASQLPEPKRSTALEQATKLRELIIRARTEQRRLRAAADAMLSHVRGIVQQIQQGLNHAGTYGRAGRVDAGATVVTGLDMTS